MTRGTVHERQGNTEFDHSSPAVLDHYQPRLFIGGTELASYGANPTRDGDYTFDGTRCKGTTMIRLGAGASFGGATGTWSVSVPMPINLQLGNNLARRVGEGTIGITPTWPVGHEYGAFHTAHFGVKCHAGRYENLADPNAMYLIGREAQPLGAGLQHNSPNPFLITASTAAGYYIAKTPIAESEWKDFHLEFDYPVLGTH